MAKGDSQEMQKNLEDTGASNASANNLLGYGAGNKPGTVSTKPTAGNMLGQNLNAQNNYNNAIATNSNDYNQIMGGYRDFSQNGGYSPQNIQDIRARSLSPIRSIYQNAQADMSRQRSLQGGYSPNYMAASAQMARNLGQQLGDANTNINAGIGQMQQQGRLAGMQGMQNAYSSTPGMASMYGNQLANSNQQLLGLGQMGQNANAQYLQGKLGQSQIPGDYQQALGNIGGTIGLVGKAVGAVSGLQALGKG